MQIPNNPAFKRFSMVRNGWAKTLMVVPFCFFYLMLSSGVAEEWHLLSPKPYQVFQRSHLQGGNLTVHGTVTWSGSGHGILETRLHGDDKVPWHVLGDIVSGVSFSFVQSLKSGGWYQLELRVVSDGVPVADHVVAKVGMGEVFIVAGQSNSANHGEERQQTRTGMVASFDGEHWALSVDPQPGASGNGGSLIPPLGDLLASRLDVPIGFVACGIGATSVREWMPKGFQFPNPPTLTRRVVALADGQWASDGRAYSMFIQRMRALGPQGFRAVLWHQGESDANQKDPTRTLPGKLYRDYLTKLIESSCQEIEWEAPWFVAQVSYHTPDDPGSPDIRAAQASLWEDGIALRGPDSDAIQGMFRERKGQGVHFSASGLHEHARRWAARILPWIKPDAAGPTTDP